MKRAAGGKRGIEKVIFLHQKSVSQNVARATFGMTFHILVTHNGLSVAAKRTLSGRKNGLKMPLF